MRWLSFMCLIVCSLSCKKESIQLDLATLDSATTADIYDLTFIDDNTAYFCGGKLWQSGVVGKSIDGGLGWEIVLETDNVLFAVAFKNKNEGVAVGFSGRTWRTKDGGSTWTLTENAPDFPVLRDVTFLTPDSLIIAAGSNYYSGGFVSYNFENENYTDSLINQDMQALYFFNQQEGLIVGYGAVFKTYNAGDTWSPNAVKGDYFKDLDFNNQGNGVLIGYQGKIFESVNRGASWERNAKKASFFSGKGNLESVDIKEASAFIAGQNGSLLYAADFLNNEWLVVETPFTNDFLKVYLIDPNQGFVTGSDGLLFKFNY